ncbi:MAG: hypothetical protein V3S89_01815, partial [Desulfobacterales bacterium]
MNRNSLTEAMKRLRHSLLALATPIPMLAWLVGGLAAVAAEHIVGNLLAVLLGLPKIPVLFGCIVMMKTPLLIPSAAAYGCLIYLIPTVGVARLT